MYKIYLTYTYLYNIIVYAKEEIIMKKLYKFLSFIIISILLCSLTACNIDNSSSNIDDAPYEIELTLDNYNYYLTITTQLTGSGRAAGGCHCVRSGHPLGRAQQPPIQGGQLQGADGAHHRRASSEHAAV